MTRRGEERAREAAVPPGREPSGLPTSSKPGLFFSCGVSDTLATDHPRGTPKNPPKLTPSLTPSGCTVQFCEHTVPVEHTPYLQDACVSRIEAPPPVSSTRDSFHAVTGPVARTTRVLARWLQAGAAGCKGTTLPRASTPEHRMASDGGGSWAVRRRGSGILGTLNPQP